MADGEGKGRAEQVSAATLCSSGLVALPQQVSQGPVEGFEICKFAARIGRLQKTVVLAARLIGEQLRRGGFRLGAWFYTFTYREGVEWSPRHISEFRKNFKRWCERRGIFCAMVWVLEFTLRGRPHYHALVFLPLGFVPPKPDKQGWWKHGMTQRQQAKKPIAYMCKYASKCCPDMAMAAPKGARLHGVSGLDAEGARQVRVRKSPQGAREALGLDADIRKALGGYLDRATGTFWPSPWRVFFDGAGRLFCIKVENVNS